MSARRPIFNALVAPFAGDIVTHDEAKRLLDEHRDEVLREAVETARDEYLTDSTGTDEDEAYNQAISDVVAAIGGLLESEDRS